MPKKSKYYVRADGLHETIRNINGKRVAFRGATDAEVDKKMLAYRGEIERGRLFKDIAEEWKDVHFPTLAPNSLSNYRPALSRAIKEFGETPIKTIKTHDIKKFISEFSRGGKSRKTVTTQRLIVNLVFKYAIEIGELENNPCAYVTIPKNLSQEHRQPATTEDEKRVTENIETWIFPFFVLYTGLRRGEALAVTYDDIDLKTMQITVEKSVYFQNNKPYIKSPKTAAGVRKVPILAPLAEKLSHKKGKGYIFSADGGNTPLNFMQFKTLYKNFIKVSGIAATPHQLRHSYATMLFECDIAIKDAQDLLGHTTAAMTQDIYTHIRESHRAKTIQTLNDKINEKLNANTNNTQQPIQTEI